MNIYTPHPFASPFVLNVSQSLATKIAVIKESIKPENGEEGKDFFFSISGPVPDSSLLASEITNPSTKKLPGKFSADPSGFGGNVAVPIEINGDHVVNVSYDGVSINGSPFEFEIKPRAAKSPKDGLLMPCG